jgi:hypothetical protein
MISLAQIIREQPDEKEHQARKDQREKDEQTGHGEGSLTSQTAKMQGRFDRLPTPRAAGEDQANAPAAQAIAGRAGRDGF